MTRILWEGIDTYDGLLEQEPNAAMSSCQANKNDDMLTDRAATHLAKTNYLTEAST
jgi:hypothetical protein